MKKKRRRRIEAKDIHGRMGMLMFILLTGIGHEINRNVLLGGGVIVLMTMNTFC
jgi:hypothetical protein